MKLRAAGLLLVWLSYAQTAPEATLSGRITDAATHQPIEGARIACRGGSPGVKPASTVSDASGAYTLRVAAAVRNGLEISKAGYSTLDLASSDRMDVRLSPGDSETRDFELSKPGSLTGHLTDRESGKPLAAYYIHAIRWYEGMENSTGFRYPAAPTSADGAFSIANLPPARYAIVIDPPMGGKIFVPDAKLAGKDEPGYGPSWYPGVPRPEMATPVVLGYAENGQIELRLQKHELRHIAGTFHVPEGLEAGSISITLGTEEKGRPTGAEGEIPRAGPFRIEGLEEGSYRVLAAVRSQDGRNRAFASQPVALTSHSADDLSIELRPAVALRVEVKMAEEKAEPPARFHFAPLSADGWGPMDDDPPGSAPRMLRTGLPPGKYDIALMQMPGYAVVSMTLNGTPLPAGAPVDLEGPESLLTYVLTKELGSVTGTVRDSEQQAVADATVVLANESFLESDGARFALPPGAGGMLQSDAAGRFSFNGLAPGRYRVFAWKGTDRRLAIDAGFIRGQMRTAQQVTVTAGTSASLELPLGK